MIDVAPLRFGPLVTLEDALKELRRIETHLENLRRQETIIFKGGGTPEGATAAPVGAIYQRTDGGALLKEDGDAILQEEGIHLLKNASFYVKESGASTSTGWVAK